MPAVLGSPLTTGSFPALLFISPTPLTSHSRPLLALRLPSVFSWENCRPARLASAKLSHSTLQYFNVCIQPTLRVFTVGSEQVGSLSINWSCSNPQLISLKSFEAKSSTVRHSRLRMERSGRMSDAIPGISSEWLPAGTLVAPGLARLNLSTQAGAEPQDIRTKLESTDTSDPPHNTPQASNQIPSDNSGSNAESVEATFEPDVGEELGPLVQHIVLRKDLADTLKWPLGSIITQGCHAAVAAIWQHQEDPLVKLYCGDLDRMHKVVLEVKGETQLLNLAERLKSAGISHKVWVEQPENIPTCLATKPCYKSQVAPHFKKLKLCK